MLHEIDTDLFHNLYVTFSKRLIQFSLRAGIELEISKELMQQAFLLLIVKYDKIIETNRNIPGWLIKANQNLIRKELTCSRRKYEVSMYEWFDASSSDVYHFPLKDVMPAGLTERHQTILVLRYEERLPYKEIAQRMDISEGYVGVLLSRALKELRKLYESEEKRLARGTTFIA